KVKVGFEPPGPLGDNSAPLLLAAMPVSVIAAAERFVPDALQIWSASPTVEPMFFASLGSYFRQMAYATRYWNALVDGLPATSVLWTVNVCRPSVLVSSAAPVALAVVPSLPVQVSTPESTSAHP